MVKLIKKEFGDTYKLMGFIYGVLILSTAVIALCLRFDADVFLDNLGQKNQALGMISGVILMMLFFIYIIASIASVSVMYFYAIARFRKTLLNDRESKPWKLILAKCITSTIWTLLGFLLIVLSYVALIFGTGRSEFYMAFSEVVKILGFGDEIRPENLRFLMDVAICGGIACVISVAVEYIMVYASMAVGYSFKMHKGLMSVLIYVLLMWATTLFEENVFGIFIISGAVVMKFTELIMFTTLLVLIQGVIYFAIANYYMKKISNKSEMADDVIDS